jgi:hypothetical protein
VDTQLKTDIQHQKKAQKSQSKAPLSSSRVVEEPPTIEELDEVVFVSKRPRRKTKALSHLNIYKIGTS